MSNHHWRTTPGYSTARPVTGWPVQRRHALICAVSALVLCLAGCTESVSEPTSPVAAPEAPAATLPPWQAVGSLSIIYPLESTEVSAGEDVRISLHLVDHDGRAVEGATVYAELSSPSGELHASLPCAHRGDGQYLSEYVRLPLRGAGGTWHVLAKATWSDSQQAEAEGTFEAMPSVSEIYQGRYGFWIEHPRAFGLGTGFYNLSETGALHFEDWLDQDGSGYVILDNYRYEPAGVTFAALEIHWRQAEFPPDGAAAIAFAQSVAERGLHHQDPGTPVTVLTAERAWFQGRAAWQVVGWGKQYYVSAPGAQYPVEWLIFSCPGSEWLWSLLLCTNREVYMDHLRLVQETFECPPEPLRRED